MFNVQPTAKIIWCWGRGLKSNPTDWRSQGINTQSLVHKACGLSTTPQRLLNEIVHKAKFWRLLKRICKLSCLNLTVNFEIFKLSISIYMKTAINCVTGSGIIHGKCNIK